MIARPGLARAGLVRPPAASAPGLKILLESSALYGERPPCRQRMLTLGETDLMCRSNDEESVRRGPDEALTYLADRNPRRAR